MVERPTRESIKTMNDLQPLPSKSLYLVTDKGFLLRYILSILVMGNLLMCCYFVPLLKKTTKDIFFHINHGLLSFAHNLAWWSMLSLLSSSCCALQLILNTFSLGCAGLNTVLGPIRPLSLAFTTLNQISTWCIAWYRPWLWGWTFMSTVVVVSLTFLPEILAFYTAKTKPKINGKNESKMENKFKQTYCYHLDNIGCSACMTTVSNVLKTIPTIDDFHISLDNGGMLFVTIIHTKFDKSEDEECIVKKALDEAGFPLRLRHPYK